MTTRKTLVWYWYHITAMSGTTTPLRLVPQKCYSGTERVILSVTPYFSKIPVLNTFKNRFVYPCLLFFSFLICMFLFFIVYLQRKINRLRLMTAFALNNLWTYLQGLSLSQTDREWLASKLIMPKEKTIELSPEERKAEFLKMAGIWSDTEEGEEYYQMMKHRNDGRPLNREIILDD